MSRPVALLVAALGLLPLPSGSVVARAGATELLERADASRHVIEEGVIRVRAVVEDEKATTESLLDVLVRGTDHVLCIFRDGPYVGRRILAVGDQVWLIVPNTTHAIRISANQRLLGGASIADVTRLRFATDFDATLESEPEIVDGTPCRVLRLKSATPRSPYASGTLWTGVEDELPYRARFSLPSGKEAKELRFAAYDRDRGKVVLRRLEIHHLLRGERGRVTVLEFVSYDSRPVALEWFEPERARAVP